MFNDIKLESDLNINENDVPYDLICGNCSIEVFENKKINFQGKYKIIEYTNELLIIKKRKGRIIISGNDLSICNVRKTSFSLLGNIESIVYE